MEEIHIERDISLECELHCFNESKALIAALPDQNALIIGLEIENCEVCPEETRYNECTHTRNNKALPESGTYFMYSAERFPYFHSFRRSDIPLAPGRCDYKMVKTTVLKANFEKLLSVATRLRWPNVKLGWGHSGALVLTAEHESSILARVVIPGYELE